MSSTISLADRASACLDHVRAYELDPASYWLALAKVREWVTPSIPPQAHPSFTTLPDIHGFVWIHTLKAVMQDPSGQIVVDGKNYRVLTTTGLEAFDVYTLSTSKALYAYYEAEIVAQEVGPEARWHMTAVIRKPQFLAYPSRLYPGRFISKESILSYQVSMIQSGTRVDSPSNSRIVYKLLRRF